MAFIIRFIDESGVIELEAETLTEAERLLEFLKEADARNVSVHRVGHGSNDTDLSS